MTFKPVEMRTIAALFVSPSGPYFKSEGVEPWGIPYKDARFYPGPYPVVAHPPCERWGKFSTGGMYRPGTKKRGEDNGCFQSALNSVRKWGGILEHPWGSKAWEHFGISLPDKKGGWFPAGDGIGYTCLVEQGNYGHKARKPTLLYTVRCARIELVWGKSPDKWREDPTKSERWKKRAEKDGVCVLLSKKDRTNTPEEFKNLLLYIARTSK